jgi:hypothetical protein
MALSFKPVGEKPVGEKPDWATDTQWTYLTAVEAHGSGAEAARALGVTKDSVNKSIRAYHREAARQGHAPGHWNSGTAPGYVMGKVTVHRLERDEKGRVVAENWERQHPEGVTLEALINHCEDRLKDFPALSPRPAPAPATATAALLTNFLGLFDLHIGESISSDDPAGRWNLATARRTITASADHAIMAAPKAKRIVVCFGGDAAHYDSLKAVTPRSKHVLHADGDASDMADVVMDVAYHVIDRALETHEEVHVIWAEGNHDEYTTVWMQRMIARTYRDEPRLSIVMSRVPYYALLFGKVMICVHHGHGSKLTELAGKFAAMFRSLWGQAEYAYAHAGHQHHIHEKEKDGLLATQHPSLAPSDDYALSKGLVSRRGCLMVTYHDEYGEVARNTTRPEMLGVFEDDHADRRAA